MKPPRIPRGDLDWIMSFQGTLAWHEGSCLGASGLRQTVRIHTLPRSRFNAAKSQPCRSEGPADQSSGNSDCHPVLKTQAKSSGIWQWEVCQSLTRQSQGDSSPVCWDSDPPIAGKCPLNGIS